MAARASTALLRVLSAALACLMGLFCFRKDSPGPEPQPLYGVASVEYHVSGVVQTRASRTPISGIEVTLRDTVGTQLASNDFSDSLGRYAVTISYLPPEFALRLSASDVDGAVNGSFAAKDTVITFSDTEVVSGRVERTVDLELDSAQ